MREQIYPLNSRRLTARIIGRIAEALEVPTRGSLEDTRQMLEGKLVEGGKEPRNVQVVLDETDEGVAVRLADEDGTFLEVPPVRDRDDSEGEDRGAVELASGAESDGEGGAARRWRR